MSDSTEHVIHVDVPLSPANIEHVAGRAQIVGPTDDDLQGIAASVIGVGHFWDDERFAKFPALRVLSRSGIGYDNIDLDAAVAAGVTVCNAPDSPTVSTAEHAMALMLAVTKDLPALHQRARSGGWGIPTPRSLELDGSVLGLVGIGRIGRRVAVAADALGMRVIAHDPAPVDQPPACVEMVDLDTVIESSDVISLHAPAIPATHHLVSGASIARMKRGVYIVNCARGPLIDEAALIEALDSGHVAGAGLDVTDPEPPDVGNPLLQRDNVILTPHIASSTVAGRARLFAHAFDNALAVLDGRPATIVAAP